MRTMKSEYLLKKRYAELKDTYCLELSQIKDCLHILDGRGRIIVEHYLNLNSKPCLTTSEIGALPEVSCSSSWTRLLNRKAIRKIQREVWGYDGQKTRQI